MCIMMGKCIRHQSEQVSAISVRLVVYSNLLIIVSGIPLRSVMMESSDGETGEAAPLMAITDDTEDDELTGCGGSLACDPRRPLHKYLVLIIMCFLSFGEFFADLLCCL